MREIRHWLGRNARAALKRRNYELLNREVMRFGIDPLRDVKTLSRRIGVTIKTCFDVGANEGQTAFALVDEFPDAIIHAFEPVHDTYAVLAEKLRRHNQCRLHNIALGEETCDTTIFVYDSSLLSSLSSKAPYPTRSSMTARSEPCRVMTLDDFCSENAISRIDYLKIDTEGCDLGVLRGGRKNLASGIPFVSVEFNAFRAANGVPSLDDIRGFLDPLGYTCVATYTDEIHTTLDWVLVANALFVLTAAHKANGE